jgi:filamentous hemagglutinin
LGQFLDEAGNVIETPTYGHIYGRENRRILAAADELNLSQAQLNEYVNARPGFFRVEEESRNLSHIDEMPGSGDYDEILLDMEEFFGIE